MAALSAQQLVWAYANGVFPMAPSAQSSKIEWFDPDPRGVVPLEAVHVPRSLKRTLRRGRFEIRIDTAFAETMAGCADRSSTWINSDIKRAYFELFELGFAHSIESWCDGELAGGLYGVHLKAAFFGESMFARRSDASKVAFVHLVARLRAGGFALLDTQMVTDHMLQFGAVEIPRRDYRRQLAAALGSDATFYRTPEPAVLAALQSLTQTS
ncbi:MAG: leucyl/phenylalanyl-tRNA--protein transferase [Telmatospirillum sp.]|nr:leucyl/phenylalanyl-tRNA--protein transferase [Telmatospirillum sp.]